MKKAILIFAIALTAGLCTGQTVKESEVPSSVKKTLFDRYPTNKVEKWERTKTGYLAQFKNNNALTDVVIDANGDWVKTKTRIDATMLPKNASAYIENTYKGKKISKASRVDNSSGKVGYEAEVDDKIIHFDDNGNFVSSEKD